MEGNGAGPIFSHTGSLAPRAPIGGAVIASSLRKLHGLGSCFPELRRIKAGSEGLAEFPALRVINRVEWWWRDHTMKVVLEILVRVALK